MIATIAEEKKVHHFPAIAELFFAAIEATTAIVAVIWKPGLTDHILKKACGAIEKKKATTRTNKNQKN